MARIKAVCVAGIAVTLISSACSSSNKTSSTTTTTPPTTSAPATTAAASSSSASTAATVTGGSAAAPSGDPVVVGTIYPYTGVPAFPDLKYIAEIAVNVVNDAGGIHGRPMKWVSCDDKNDPNTAATCADQVINQDGALAMIGQIGEETQVPWTLIKSKNRISWFGSPFTPDDGTSTQSFPAALGSQGFRNVSIAVKQNEFKKADCITGDVPQGKSLCDWAKQSLATKGITDFNEVLFPLTTTAFQPYAAKVVADGADLVVIPNADAGTAVIVQALADAGAKVTIVQPSGAVGDRTFAVAKQNNIPLRIVAAWGLDPNLFPGRKKMLDAIQKYASKVGAPTGFDTSSEEAVQTYLGIITFADVMNKVTNITDDDFTKYVTTHPITTGMSAPLDWTKPGPITDTPRIVNVYANPETLKDGQPTAQTTTFSSGFPGVTDVTGA